MRPRALATPAPARLRRRLSMTLVSALVLAPLLAVMTAGTASAATYRAFTPVYSVNTNGDILLAANTLMTCVTSAGCTTARAATSGNYNNNNYSMQFVDVDANPGTFTSSSATLTIPAGGSVLFAALTWGGRTGATAATNANPALRGTAVLTVPGGTPTTVTATQVDVSPDYAYQSYLDVTAQVAAAGSGTYTVGNVQSASGGTNQYAGWSLVVAVADPAAPARNLTVFTGFASVATGDPLPPFTVSGFLTPPAGPVQTTLGAVTYEGDMGLVGDTFQLDGTTISDALNPGTNPFNSTISNRGAQVAGRTPGYANQLGFDADLFSANGILANSATSATLSLTTAGDQFFPGVVTFATDLYDPKLLGTKTVTDVDGGSVDPGDLLRYTVPVENIGLDTSVQSRFFDAIPTGTTYVPGSITLDGVPQTDALDGDTTQFVADDNGHVLSYLGAGATPTSGGAIPMTGGTTQHLITFDVTVDLDATNGQELTNAAALTYRGLTTEASSSSATNAVISPVVTAPLPGNAPPDATPHVVTFEPTPGARDIDITVLAGDTDPEGDPLTVVAVTDAAGGVVTINADGTVTYAPRDDFAGRDVFTYTIEDTAGNRSTATIQVEVVNVAPVAADDAAATIIDAPVVVDVLTNDTDPNGDALAVRSVDAASTAGGTVTLVGGVVTYTPPAGFSGTDTFAYVLEDSRGGSDTATVTVTVTNGVPVAGDDGYVTDAGVPVALDVRANDSDPNGDVLTVALATGPTHGAVVLAADGTGTYTPAPGWSGTDTFTYTVADGRGGSDTATVTVTTNAPPVTGDDTGTTTLDTPVTLVVLADDTDPDGDALAVVGATAPTNGIVIVNADGTIMYAPDLGWAGSDTFTYTVTDGRLTDTATVTVTTANAVPVAGADTASTPTDTPLVGFDVLGNDTDPNVAAGVPGQALEVTDAVADNGAVVMVAPDSTLTVIPAPGYAGPVVVTYTVSDGAGGTATGTLTLTVDNATPSAVADGPVNTPTDTPVTVDVLANDTDPNAPASQVLVVTDAVADNGATVVVNGDSTLTVTPASGYAGPITVTYTISDGAGGTASTTLAVTVDNADPVAEDDVALTPADTAATVHVLANDTDPNIPGTAQVLTVIGAVADNGAVVVVNPDDSVTMTPAPGFAGLVTVTYTVSDGAGGTASATLTVSVENAPPVAVDDAVSTPYAVPVVVDVLAGDTDANGDPLAVLVVDALSTEGGTVTLVGGVVTYAPPLGFRGTDTFTYTVTDGVGGTATGTVTVTVTNTAPVADDDAYAVLEGSSAPLAVRTNDSDPDGDPLSVALVTGPVGGSLTLNADGTGTYTPSAGFSGVDTFTYQVSDGFGGTDVATVTITVDGAPSALPDVASTPGETPVNVVVLTNDSDPEAGPLAVSVVASPAHGSAVAEADGSVTYTPDTGWAGTDTFTYQVTDAAGLTDTAEVTVTVANQAPVPGTDTASTATDTPLVGFPVLANDTDPNVSAGVPGQALSVTGAVADQGADVVVNPDGTLTVTPAAGYAGPVVVTYTVADGAGGTATGTLTVTVDNAAPSAAADGPVSTPTDTPVSIDVLANDTDPNGDPLTIAPGTVTAPVDADGAPAGDVDLIDGELVYTPPPGFAGEVTFEYGVTDGDAVVTTIVTVVVENAAPVADDDAASTASGTPVTVDVLADDTDPNIPGTDQELTVIGAVADNGAGVVVNPDGTLTVTPAPGFEGEITVTVTISDGAGGTDTSTLTVTVDNAAPVAVDDAATTPYATPVDVDLLGNDTDANPGDTVTVVPGSVTDPVDAGGTTRGTVAVVDGVATYTPPAGFSGQITFDYTITDGTTTSTATVTITVGNAPPVATGDAAVTVTGQPVTIDVVGNDTDPDGGALTVVEVTQPSSGTVTIVDGRIVYTPEPGFTGTVTFTYVVSDGQGGTSTGTVTVVVSAAPVIAAPRTPLALTGTDVARLGSVAALLLAGGLVLVLVARRRRTA